MLLQISYFLTLFEKLQPPLITKADKGDKQSAVIVWKFIMMHWGRSQFTNKYIQVQNNK